MVCVAAAAAAFGLVSVSGGARGRVVAWGDDGSWSTLAGLVARA